MENLSIKLIKGHKYLYITDVFKVNSKSKKVTFYIGNIEKINENEFILKLREFNEFRLTKIIEIAQNLYHSPYLSGENIAYLEKLRVLFSRFRILYPDETDRYRTNMYTRYVQGTVAIEGNTISPIEAGLLLNKGISPDGKRVDEIYEIMNFLHLQNYLHEYQEEISERLIRRIHAIIMENLMHTPGDYRNLDVQIEKVEYLPPPSFEVPHMMQDLIKWYKQNKNNLHPFLLAVFFHAKFEIIHPFLNGNGRVGRAVVNFILEKFSYPTLYLGLEHRNEYLKALLSADEGNFFPLVQTLTGFYKIQNEKILGQIEKREMNEDYIRRSEHKYLIEKFRLLKRG